MSGQDGVYDESPSSAGPEEAGTGQLVRQVRAALASLSDLSYLQTNPLARLQSRRSATSPANSAQMLQQRLLDAIEHLRPASEDHTASERVARRYDLLRLRYIEGLDVKVVCQHLGCSRSDYYRQLDLGLRAVTAYLESDLISGSGPIPLLTSVGYETPLVGREQELELLKAAYSAAASGDGGKIVMIAGDQGIGKTRLAQELGRYVGQQGGLFLQGRWAAWEGAAPYGAVAETLRRGLRQFEPEEVAAVVGPYGPDLARLFPELVQHTAARPDNTLLSPEEQQLRLYEGVSSVIHNLSLKQPLVMFLDDLHLAPQMRLQLHIARRLQEVRLLIVYAYREDELIERPVLVAGRNELVRSRLVTDIRLAPLTPAETGRIIAHTFGEAAAAQLQAPTYEINKGNPFFVEEMVRYMVENNAVRWVQGRWEVLDTTRVGIPESVKLLVQERVARLGEEVVAVLQQAAVLGQEFSFAALSLMANRPEDRLVALLDQAMVGGFLVDCTITAEERYCFRESHIQDVLYQSIPAARRRRYHLQAGQALLVLYPDLLEELAYHFTHGGDVARGATYSHQAAERASSLFSWNRAIPLYQDALDMWEELGGHLEERAAVAEKLGDAFYKSGIEAQRAVGYLQQALRFNEELGNRHKVATLHSQLGREYMHSGNLVVQDIAQALEQFHVAKNILELESEDVPQGMVYCGLAMAHLDHLDLKEAVSWAGRAVELGERLDAPSVVANACAPLGAVMARSAITQASEALERGWRTSFDNNLGFQADLNRAFGARAMGVALKDPKSGLGWVGRGPDYRTTYSLFDIPSHLVALHALNGELAEASQILGELQGRLRELGQHTFGLWPDELGLLWVRQGAWEHAEAQLSEAFDWAVKSENHVVEAATAERLGEVYLALQQYDEAEGYLLHALDSIRGSASVVGELALLPHICELYLRTGRLEMAGQHLIRAQNIAGGSTDWRGLKGDLRLAEGLVLATLGNWRDAETVFQQAIQVYQEFLLPWDEARVCYEWATELMGKGADGSRGSRARARALLTRALSLWEPMGADRYADLCRRRLG